MRLAEMERALLEAVTPDAFGAMVADLAGLPLPELQRLQGRVNVFFHDERRRRT